MLWKSRSGQYFLGGTAEENISNAIADKVALNNLEPGVTEATEDLSIDPNTGEQVRIGSELFFSNQAEQAMAFYYNYGHLRYSYNNRGRSWAATRRAWKYRASFAMSFTFLKDQILNKLQAYLQV